MNGFVCRVTFTLSRVPCAVFVALFAAYLVSQVHKLPQSQCTAS